MKRTSETDPQAASGLFLGSEPLDHLQRGKISATGDDSDKKDLADGDTGDDDATDADEKDSDLTDKKDDDGGDTDGRD
jgi:hypothetical protein